MFLTSNLRCARQRMCRWRCGICDVPGHAVSGRSRVEATFETQLLVYLLYLCLVCLFEVSCRQYMPCPVESRETSQFVLIAFSQSGLASKLSQTETICKELPGLVFILSVEAVKHLSVQPSVLDIMLSVSDPQSA